MAPALADSSPTPTFVEEDAASALRELRPILPFLLVGTISMLILVVAYSYFLFSAYRSYRHRIAPPLSPPPRKLLLPSLLANPGSPTLGATVAALPAHSALLATAPVSMGLRPHGQAHHQSMDFECRGLSRSSSFGASWGRALADLFGRSDGVEGQDGILSRVMTMGSRFDKNARQENAVRAQEGAVLRTNVPRARLFRYTMRLGNGGTQRTRSSSPLLDEGSVEDLGILVDERETRQTRENAPLLGRSNHPPSLPLINFPVPPPDSAMPFTPTFLPVNLDLLSTSRFSDELEAEMDFGLRRARSDSGILLPAVPEPAYVTAAARTIIEEQFMDAILLEGEDGRLSSLTRSSYRLSSGSEDDYYLVAQ
ncbi:hypothetical protein BV25DRAFT_1348858 [Artomyces pyxidatus]|uniref:Uncharacterized protein n=1 Tax=Artomyces pyxidatus TaxID=48021 RepID=A0ACB8SNN6_9AGAM|nr:hypothetical protein BV25DRAFT_1348858 [Artomyces pyxidatus]